VILTGERSGTNTILSGSDYMIENGRRGVANGSLNTPGVRNACSMDYMFPLLTFII
jgi:hypothetical protein